MPAFEKGSSLKSNYAAVRAELGSAEWNRVLDALDPEDREIVLAPETHLLVPTAVTGRLYTSVHRIACGGDRARTEQLLRSAGGRAADDMLEGAFSVFARFVSPQQAFKRAGGIVSSVFSGVESQTITHDAGNGGQLSLSGFDDYPYAACLIGGWIERALVRFGARSGSVVERAWEAGRDRTPTLVFDISWKG
jgi:hypothetical protein